MRTCGQPAWTRLVTWMPSMSGMLKSRTSMSGCSALDQAQSFFPARRFAHQFQASFALQKSAQAGAHDGMIIRDQDACRHTAPPLRSPSPFPGRSQRSTCRITSPPARAFRTSPTWLPLTGLVWVKADPVVLNRQHHHSVAAVQEHIHLRRMGMQRYVGQRFLDNAEQGCFQLTPAAGCHRSRLSQTAHQDDIGD